MLVADQRTTDGEKGGVIRIIYVASWVLKEGETMPGAGDIEGLRKYASEGLDEEVLCLPFLLCYPLDYRWVVRS